MKEDSQNEQTYNIWKNYWFWLFLIIKISLFALPPGQVAKNLFIPFLDSGTQHIFNNPWNHFTANYFPYGSVLYLIMLAPKTLLFLIFGTASIGNTLLSSIALKLPLLIADILFLHLLLNFPTTRNKKWFILFYWMNPILLFINYVHVQLDIFAVLFVFIALKCICSKSEKFSAISLACAILCKFHIVILVPLFMSYFWRTKFKNQAIRTLIIWTFILFGIVIIGFLPHIFSSQIGYISIQSPEAMKIFSLVFTLDSQNKIYIGFGIVIAILVRLLLASRITEQGLIYSCGLMLGLLLITTSSMPGWYYWTYPFLALFLSQYIVRIQFILFSSYLFYLFYFLPTELGLNLPNHFLAISFTLLQLSLLGVLISIWIYVIRFEMPLMRRNRPLLIGIAGDSGAGKNTLSNTFFDLFGHQATSLVEGDDYHRWERGNTHWQDFTHLNPRANYLETLSRHVFMLLQGRPVYKSHYDHQIGQFTDERLIQTKKNIIVQGLHAFYPLLLRKMMDIKIFTHPNEHLRLFWKLKRDLAERGHTRDQVIQSFKNRQYDSLIHILPQKNHADWVMEYIPVDSQFKITPSNIESIDFSSPPEVFQVHKILNDTPIELLINELNTISTLRVLCTNDKEDMDFLRVEIFGKISSEQIEMVANKVFGILRHLTRSYNPPVWHANFDGINQLIFLAIVQRIENLI